RRPEGRRLVKPNLRGPITAAYHREPQQEGLASNASINIPPPNFQDPLPGQEARPQGARRRDWQFHRHQHPDRAAEAPAWPRSRPAVVHRTGHLPPAARAAAAPQADGPPGRARARDDDDRAGGRTCRDGSPGTWPGASLFSLPGRGPADEGRRIVRIVEGITANQEHVWIVIVGTAEGEKVEVHFRTRADAVSYRNALVALRRESPDGLERHLQKVVDHLEQAGGAS